MRRTALASFMSLLQLAILFQLLNMVTAGPPIVEIIATSKIDSPKYKTYSSGELPLNVVVTGDASGRYYTVQYRVIHLDTSVFDDLKGLGTYYDDGKPKVYNSTLRLNQDGRYELRVTIQHGSSSGAYSQVNFSVKTNQPEPSPEPQPEPFPTTLALGILVAVAVVCIGLLVYFRKRRGEAKPS